MQWNTREKALPKRGWKEEPGDLNLNEQQNAWEWQAPGKDDSDKGA